MVSGTIAPAREIPDGMGNNGFNPDSPVLIILANLNLVVPVVSAMLVIIVAIIVMCFLRGKGDQHKGKPFISNFVLISGTIAPPLRGGIPTVHHFFPWIPAWVDLNVIVPVSATIVVIVVGIVVICVAFARRSRGPEQTRLRGDICNVEFHHSSHSII